jgi:hypothetical protein
VKSWSNNRTRSSNNPTKNNALLASTYVHPNPYY